MSGISKNIQSEEERVAFLNEENNRLEGEIKEKKEILERCIVDYENMVSFNEKELTEKNAKILELNNEIETLEKRKTDEDKSVSIFGEEKLKIRTEINKLKIEKDFIVGHSEELKKESESLTSKIALFKDEQSSLLTDISNKKLELEKVVLSLNSKRVELADREIELSKKEDFCLKKEVSLKEKEKILREAEKNLELLKIQQEEKGKNLTGNNALLEVREKELIAKEQDILNQTVLLNKQNNDFEVRKIELDKREKELKDREQDFIVRDSDVKAREKMVKAREKLLT